MSVSEWHTHTHHLHKKTSEPTGISFIAIEVENIVTRRVLDFLVRSDCLDPPSQSATLVGRRPPSIWLENAGEAQQPRRNRDVNISHDGTLYSYCYEPLRH